MKTKRKTATRTIFQLYFTDTIRTILLTCKLYFTDLLNSILLTY